MSELPVDAAIVVQQSLILGNFESTNQANSTLFRARRPKIMQDACSHLANIFGLNLNLLL